MDDKETLSPNLDKLRDEKCFPIAQAIMEEMATGLIPEDANPTFSYEGITIKALSAFFDADLNVGTEAAYVPQLILGVLSGLNNAAHSCELTPIDYVRYNILGRKILDIVAKAHVELNVTKDKEEAAFANIKEQVQQLFTEEKLNGLEVKYVMENIFDSFKAFNNLLAGSLEKSTERAEAKAFGIMSMDELTMKGLDGFLKANVDK